DAGQSGPRGVRARPRRLQLPPHQPAGGRGGRAARAARTRVGGEAAHCRDVRAGVRGRRRAHADARGVLGTQHLLALHRARRSTALRRRRARPDAPAPAGADRIAPAVAAAASIAGPLRIDRHRLPRRRTPARDGALPAVIGRADAGGAGGGHRDGDGLRGSTRQDPRMNRIRVRAAGTPRRVLVHTGTTDLCNAGDAAMLQSAVARLAGLWPDAAIAVITGRPQALARLCPGVQAVPADAVREWAADRYLFGHLETHIPSPARAPLSSMERALRRRWPQGATRLACARWRLGGHDPAPLREGLAAIARADLLFVCGQGTLADAAAARAHGLLGLMEGARALGVPAVLVGQGIGPIHD